MIYPECKAEIEKVIVIFRAWQYAILKDSGDTLELERYDKGD